MIQEKIKNLTAHIAEQERTINEISREIHDNIGQILSFTKMNMIVIQKFATDQRQIELLKKNTELIDSLIKDILNINHSINSSYIARHGLFKILNDKLNGLKLSSVIDTIGTSRIFNPDKELLLYRIAQEAIHNIIKHASASKVIITLIYEQYAFCMKISDDGIGFEKHKENDPSGFGFRNMYQRAKLLEGNLDIHSRLKFGTIITLTIPHI